ncbi:hypothetical protein FGO68_gene16852 [Halteria grandinella]|uniref:Uncharacterized protein n=1 Tax=Halteria grandinella TaxID=5974 RepID=A0A8J8SZZ4_HALGN|nr:hypothetical protein FGO68_gene16852 [Halteria grandinella]
MQIKLFQNQEHYTLHFLTTTTTLFLLPLHMQHHHMVFPPRQQAITTIFEYYPADTPPPTAKRPWYPPRDQETRAQPRDSLFERAPRSFGLSNQVRQGVSESKTSQPPCAVTLSPRPALVQSLADTRDQISLPPNQPNQSLHCGGGPCSGRKASETQGENHQEMISRPLMSREVSLTSSQASPQRAETVVSTSSQAEPHTTGNHVVPSDEVLAEKGQPMELVKGSTPQSFELSPSKKFGPLLPADYQTATVVSRDRQIHTKSTPILLRERKNGDRAGKPTTTTTRTLGHVRESPGIYTSLGLPGETHKSLPTSRLNLRVKYLILPRSQFN